MIPLAAYYALMATRPWQSDGPWTAYHPPPRTRPQAAPPLVPRRRRRRRRLFAATVSEPDRCGVAEQSG